MIYGIALAAVGVFGIGLLVWFVSKGGGRGTAILAALLAVAAAMLVWSIAGVYYHMPVGWIVALCAAVLASIALFVLVCRSVSWKAPKVAATVGLLLATLVLMTIVLIASPFGGLMTPVFEARGAQIAADLGFTALFPEGYDLKLDYLPVDALGGAGGLNMQYEDFTLQERKAGGTYSMADLEEILAVGEDPFAFDMSIPASAAYEELEVAGRPALGVEFSESAGGGAPKSGEPAEKQSVVRVVVFEVDGVDIRIQSEGRMEYAGGSGGDERYDYVDALGFDELVAVGEALAPLE